jgi:L-rhamnose mutarotase
MGQVVSLRPESVEEYKRLHRDAWPEVLTALSTANLRNYSIFLREPENLLFSYWEYEGDDFAADMQAMLGAPRVQDWWNLCAPMHDPFPTRAPGEWWAPMSEIFHLS